MEPQSYPRWIYYYLWFVTIVSAFFSIMIYLNPEALWNTWEAINAPGALNLDGPAGLFCARNLGVAAMGVYILTSKSKAMMEAYLVLRIVTDALDGVHAAIGGNNPVIIIGFTAAVIQAIMFVKLKQHQ